MNHKNLLRISGISLLGLLGFFQAGKTEKENRSQIKILSQPVEKSGEAKFAAFTITTEEKISVHTVSWQSNCPGYEVRAAEPYKIELYEAMTVEHSVTTCGGSEVNTMRCEGIITHIKNETGETEADKKIEPVKESRPMSYKIYPNPMISEARLEIENYNDEPYQFELYDLTGKLIMKEANVNNSVYVIPRNDLSTGIYIYRVLIASNNVPTLKSGKIVVE